MKLHCILLEGQKSFNRTNFYSSPFFFTGPFFRKGRLLDSFLLDFTPLHGFNVESETRARWFHVLVYLQGSLSNCILSLVEEIESGVSLEIQSSGPHVRLCLIPAEGFSPLWRQTFLTARRCLPIQSVIRSTYINVHIIRNAISKCGRLYKEWLRINHQPMKRDAACNSSKILNGRDWWMESVNN